MAKFIHSDRQLKVPLLRGGESWGCGSVVQCLPSKGEVPIPSASKKARIGGARERPLQVRQLAVQAGERKYRSPAPN